MSNDAMDQLTLRALRGKLRFWNDIAAEWGGDPSRVEQELIGEEKRIAQLRAWVKSEVQDRAQAKSFHGWLDHAERGVNEARKGLEKKRRMQSLAPSIKIPPDLR